MREVSRVRYDLGKGIRISKGFKFQKKGRAGRRYVVDIEITN